MLEKLVSSVVCLFLHEFTVTTLMYYDSMLYSILGHFMYVFFIVDLFKEVHLSITTSTLRFIRPTV